MGVDYDVHHGTGIRQFRGAACFIALNKGSHADIRKDGVKPSTITHMVYYPYGYKGSNKHSVNVNFTDSDVMDYVKLLKHGLNFNDVLQGRVDGMLNHGIKIPLYNKPGPYTVGVASILRYMVEEPQIARAILELRRLGIPAKAALFMSHFFMKDKWGYHTAHQNTNHAVFEGATLSTYIEFITGFRDRLKELRPYCDTTTYKGIFALFGGKEYNRGTPFPFNLKPAETDVWSPRFKRHTEQDMLEWYTKNLKPVEKKHG